MSFLLWINQISPRYRLTSWDLNEFECSPWVCFLALSLGQCTYSNYFLWVVQFCWPSDDLSGSIRVLSNDTYSHSAMFCKFLAASTSAGYVPGASSQFGSILCKGEVGGLGSRWCSYGWFWLACVVCEWCGSMAMHHMPWTLYITYG